MATFVAAVTTQASAGQGFKAHPEPAKSEKDIGHVLYENGKWRPWSKIADDVIAMSARHNHGKPVTGHVCIPEDKRCIDAVYLQIKNDGQWRYFSIATMRNPNGEVSSNKVCWFNSTSDVRQCMDWGDPHDGPVEMKDAKGEWSVVQEGDDSSKPNSKENDI
jgi:hypothetical protein